MLHIGSRQLVVFGPCGPFAQHIRQSIRTDQSLYRVMTKEQGLNDPNYIPASLHLMTTSQTIDLVADPVRVDRRILDDLTAMAAAFYANMGIPLTITSGYRTITQQQSIYDRIRSTYEEQRDDPLTAEVATQQRVALPGYSEHHLGLAIDLADMVSADDTATDAYLWMYNNARYFGFHQTYQRGVEQDGYIQETRHRRYIGIPAAMLLHTTARPFLAIGDIIPMPCDTTPNYE